MSSQLRLSLIDADGGDGDVLHARPMRSAWPRSRPQEQLDGAGLAHESSVRVIIVAGEPGGSIPATRARIEQSWGARVIDHHGLTEVGPVSFECLERPGGLHLNEAEFITEMIDPVTGVPVADGQLGELVITNLGRTASPVIRYRTGDLVVRRSGACECGRTLAWLEGGILSRADDMVAVRGVNVYPAAIEAVVRRFAEDRSSSGRRSSATVRCGRCRRDRGRLARAADAHRLAARRRELREALGLNVPVHAVAAGTLPRSEMKSKRFVVEG